MKRKADATPSYPNKRAKIDLPELPSELWEALIASSCSLLLQEETLAPVLAIRLVNKRFNHVVLHVLPSELGKTVPPKKRGDLPDEARKVHSCELYSKALHEVRTYQYYGLTVPPRDHLARVLHETWQNGIVVRRMVVLMGVLLSSGQYEKGLQTMVAALSSRKKSWTREGFLMLVIRYFSSVHKENTAALFRSLYDLLPQKSVQWAVLKGLTNARQATGLGDEMTSVQWAVLKGLTNARQATGLGDEMTSALSSHFVRFVFSPRSICNIAPPMFFNEMEEFCYPLVEDKMGVTEEAFYGPRSEALVECIEALLDNAKDAPVNQYTNPADEPAKALFRIFQFVAKSARADYFERCVRACLTFTDFAQKAPLVVGMAAYACLPTGFAAGMEKVAPLIKTWGYKDFSQTANSAQRFLGHLREENQVNTLTLFFEALLSFAKASPKGITFVSAFKDWFTEHALLGRLWRFPNLEKALLAFSPYFPPAWLTEEVRLYPGMDLLTAAKLREQSAQRILGCTQQK